MNIKLVTRFQISVIMIAATLVTNDDALAETPHEVDHSPATFADTLTQGVGEYTRLALSMVRPQEEELNLEPSRNYLISLRPQIWFPELDGDLSLENAVGFATDLDVGSELGLDDISSDFAYDVTLHLGPGILRISGFNVKSSGLRTATRNITFGDINVGLSDLVDADLDISNVKVQFGLLLFDSDTHGFNLAVSLGVDFYDFKATVTDVLSTLQDSIDEQLPIPIAGLHLELPLSDFLISADASGLVLNVENVDVSYFDLTVTVTWEPWPGIGIFGGYRMIDADLSNGDFDADITIKGPFFGGQIRF